MKKEAARGKLVPYALHNNKGLYSGNLQVGSPLLKNRQQQCLREWHNAFSHESNTSQLDLHHGMLTNSIHI